MRLRPLLASFGLLAFSSSAALAQPAEKARPAAPDTRSGHVYLAPAVGYQRPMGSAENGIQQIDYASWGPSIGGEVGLGISRYVVLQGWGHYDSFGSPDICPACTGKSSVFGLGVQYHIIDGTPFDPWISFGMGYRSMKFTAGAADVTYSGIEWARIAVGGDWHPAPIFGFGPYMELDLGRYTSRSVGTIDNPAFHSFLTVGVRAVLDPL